MTNDSKSRTVTRYRVRKWADLFENAQSRKIDRLSWVPIPNKHDGKSYRRLIAHDDGPALYAAWVLIVQVASKCPTRGVLADADGALDTDDLAAKTGVPASLFARALEVLTHPKIGWLEAELLPADSQHIGSGLPDASTDAALNRTERNRNESKKPPPPKRHAPAVSKVNEVKAVEVLLSQAGMVKAGKYARLAVDRHYTSDRVRELFDYMRAHPELGIAALATRLENSPPTTPADQGWPSSKTIRQTDTRLDRLESQFGATLNRMSYPQLRGLCGRAGFDGAANWSNDDLAHCRSTRTTRAKLIERMEAEQSEPAT